MDAAGDLFGTTSTGGANGDGTVFELQEDQWRLCATPTTIASLGGSDAFFQIGGLLMDRPGTCSVPLLTAAPIMTARCSRSNTNGSYASTPDHTLQLHRQCRWPTPNGGCHGCGRRPVRERQMMTWQRRDSLSDGSVFVLKAIDGGYTEFTIADFAAAVPQSGSSPPAALTVDAAGDLFAWPILPTTTGNVVYEIPAMAATHRVCLQNACDVRRRVRSSRCRGGGPMAPGNGPCRQPVRHDDGRQRLGLRDRICRRRQLRGDADHDRHVQRR